MMIRSVLMKTQNAVMIFIKFVNEIEMRALCITSIINEIIKKVDAHH